MFQGKYSQGNCISQRKFKLTELVLTFSTTTIPRENEAPRPKGGVSVIQNHLLPLDCPPVLVVEWGIREHHQAIILRLPGKLVHIHKPLLHLEFLLFRLYLFEGITLLSRLALSGFLNLFSKIDKIKIVKKPRRAEIKTGKSASWTVIIS